MTSFQDFSCERGDQEMPDACVVNGCNNTPNRKEGIGLHPIPFYGAEDPQKRKRRKRWVDFVQQKRAHWNDVMHVSFVPS